MNRALTAVQVAALGVLTFIYARLAEGLVPWWLPWLALAGSAMVALCAASTGVRVAPVVVAVLVSWLLLRSVLTWLLALVTAATGAPLLVAALEVAGPGLLVVSPVVVIAVAVVTASLRGDPSAGWSPGLHGLLLLLLFWGDARFSLGLFHTPAEVVALAGSLVVLDLLILILGRPRGGRRVVGGMAVLAPVLLIVVMLVFRWYSQGAVSSGGGILRPTLFQFDFAPFVTLESEITMSDDLVLIYRREGPPRRDLLRRYVLSEFDPARGFSLGRGQDAPATTFSPGSRMILPDPGWALRKPVRQEYFLINLDATTLMGLNEPVEVTPYRRWDESSFKSAYQVTSLVSAAPLSLLARSPAVSTRPGDRELLDYGDDEAIAGLAAEIADESESDLDAVRRIESYLRNEYYYSLTPGVAEDGNQLHRFLFENKKGYCSYFAFAMALMVRSLGIPARVAVGFFVDPSQEVLNFYPVAANMAHAWVEVRFGMHGWITFDPTSEQLAPGEQYETAPPVPRDEVNSLLQEILQHGLAPVDLADQERDGDGTPIRVIDRIAESWEWLLLAALLLYAAAMAVQKHGYRLVIGMVPDPRRRTILRTRGLLGELAALGYRRGPGESVIAFAQKHRALRLDSAVAPYLKAEFSVSYREKDDRRSAWAWRRCRRVTGRRTGPVRRIAAFLTPVVRVTPRRELGRGSRPAGDAPHPAPRPSRLRPGGRL